MKIRKVIFVSLLALIVMSIVFAFLENRPWVVPEEAKKLRNPVQRSDAAMKAARDLYRENCAQCHGETGKGDGPEALTHYTRPADLTDAKRISGVTDGEIFYQISEGHRPMPSFKKRLSKEQRWQLVLLVRSFAERPSAADIKPAPEPNK